MSNPNWFIENIPILGPLVGAVGVIVSGFLYQDKKISARRTILDCNEYRQDLKGTIAKSEKAIKDHLNLKLKLLATEIKTEIQSNGGKSR